MTTARQEIESDCSILLIRALYKKFVTAFGEDGVGKYGTNQFPKTFLIKDVDIEIEVISNSQDPEYSGKVFLQLNDYSSKDCGHIATDKNFLLSIQDLLENEGIDRDCLTFAKVKEQGPDFVVMNFDVPQLLSWE